MYYYVKFMKRINSIQITFKMKGMDGIKYAFIAGLFVIAKARGIDHIKPEYFTIYC